MWQEIVAIDTKLNEHRSIIFRKSFFFISKKDITDFPTMKYCNVKFLFKFLIEILDKWDFLKININTE